MQTEQWKVIPAVDLLGDKAVRLEQGDLERVRVRRDPDERCAAAGVARLVCTAIDRDGTFAGPDLELLGRVRSRSGLPVTAAGGIASEAHLEAVRRIGCEGAIVGRALIDGTLPLSVLSP